MRVANIQRFCTHDGPGIRTTVFLKGCPLRCEWCHNPETVSRQKELLFYENKCIFCNSCSVCAQGVHVVGETHTVSRARCIGCGECVKECPTNALELVGEDITPQEIYERIRKDVSFYGERGGLTVSGGEPFLQPDEVIELLSLCKKNGIGTAVETCGYFDPEIISRAAAVTDLFLWDIKDTDDERHKEYIGVSNERIIDNLLLADSLGAKTRVRCILVDGVNTNEQHYKAVADIVSGLRFCEGVELIPYHSFGGAKSLALSGDNVGNDAWIPTKDLLDCAKACLQSYGIFVF